MKYEAFLPAVDTQGQQFPPGVFRQAYEELSDQFGFVDTWPVYHPVHATLDEVTGTEYVRFQANVSNTTDNHLAIFAWKQAQQQRLGCNF